MWENRNAYRVLVRKPEPTNNFDDPGVDERITLKCVLKKHEERTWTGFTRIRIRTSTRLL
jgi:hypothetical protein